jgi:solute carrier family 7 (L-type amino acid transporter), member 6
MLLNLAISTVYLLVGDLNGLITFVGLSEYFFWFLCTIGLLFRIRPRDHKPAALCDRSGSSESGIDVERSGDDDDDDDAYAKRPYRTWTGFPVIFLIFSGVVIARGAISDPWQGVGIVGTMAAGWIVWLVKQRREEMAKIGEESEEVEQEPLLRRE